MSSNRPQPYPRIKDEGDAFYGFLDESELAPHKLTLTQEELREIIIKAIRFANGKSSRAILNIPDDANEKEVSDILRAEGYELFKYFVEYCGDPAATAHQCVNQHFSVVAREQFKNRTLQKERMNSGWRYQFIVKATADASKRFISVSDLNTKEADFNAIVACKSAPNGQVNIYVSVKNRSNTLGGQDWPKAIAALENAAQSDKNRNGPYICVFGIAIENGSRRIPGKHKDKNPHSVNTEVWLSDFFWPFFSTLSYGEIVSSVISVLIETQKPDVLSVDVPDELVKAFGEKCEQADLLDKDGNFNDVYRLGELFVHGVSAKATRKKKKNV